MQNREENGSGKMVDVGIVFQKMLMLLVMMSIGFLAGKTRVMSVEGNHMLSLLINKITMPCLVVYSSVCNAHSMSNRELLILLGIYFVSFALMIVVARLFRLLISPERGHAGIYELLLIFPNSAFIGIPVASAIYGESAVFYLSMYNLPFYVALYCYGVNLIQDTPVRKIDFHQMLSPLMIASLLGVVLYLCDVRLPALLTEPMQSVGQISTPGAMMLVGSTLSTVPVKGILRNWRLPALTVVKLVIAPVIARPLLGLFVRNAEMLGIVTLTVAMPSGSISSLLAAQYEKDEDLAAEAIFLTTICSVVTIPLMVMLLL